MDGLVQRLRTSFAASEAAYARRLASGKQPLAPAFVRNAAGGALRFLDYTDTRALVGVNAAYLLLVVALYLYMRRRTAGFTVKAAMVVCAQQHVLRALRATHPASRAVDTTAAVFPTAPSRPLTPNRRACPGVQRGVCGSRRVRGLRRGRLQVEAPGAVRVQHAGHQRRRRRLVTRAVVRHGINTAKHGQLPLCCND